MFDVIRQRASVMLLGLIAFLFILWQIPDWDSGWVQAIGSIAAIAAGFGYAALQNDLQRRQRIKDQQQAREHAISILATVLPVMRNRVQRLLEGVEAEMTFTILEAQDALDLLGGELVILRPGECGSVDFAILSREAGLELKSFAVQSKYAFQKSPVESDDVETLRRVVTTTTGLADEMKAVHDEFV